MPLYGTRDVAPLLDAVPEMARLDAPPLELPGSEAMQVMYEIDTAAMTSLLPPALGPTIPPVVVFQFWKCPESPAGPFTLAQVRLGCRAGVRQRGYLLSSYCDSETAAQLLRADWGFNCRPAGVRLRHFYDRVEGTVVVADQTVLRVALIDPQAISGADLQYVPSMHLARLPVDRGHAPRLVQVDAEFTFSRAERGRPVVEVFEPDPTAAAGVQPVYPVSASWAACNISLPPLRYLVDPTVPALQGTETLRA
jgi:hypothetical protein